MSLVSLFFLFAKGRNKTIPPMLQDVGLSLGYNPGRKLQSLVARLNNNMAVNKSRVSGFFANCFLSFSYQNQRCKLAIYLCITFWVAYSLGRDVQSRSGRGLAILRVDVLTRMPWDGSREGNLDCFGFNSRRHVCEPINGKSVVSSISSLFLLFLFLCSNLRHYRHAHGGHWLSQITSQAPFPLLAFDFC